MSEEELLELQHRVKTWFRSCCGRAGRSKNSVCTVGQRVRCELALERVLHALAYAYAAGPVDSPRQDEVRP